MSYIPTRDSQLDAWAANWTTRVQAAPATYGLSAAVAATMTGMFTTWHAAYLTASAPATRTAATVAAKDAAKGAMLPLLRLYSQQIKLNPAVLPGDKEALGIHLNDPVPTPIPPPSTYPILEVAQSSPGSMRLRFSDQASPDARRKPFGTAGLLLWKAIADDPVTDPAGAVFEGLFGRINFDVAFNNADAGKYCTFFGRWTNAKGEEGPWSTPISRVIQ